MAESIQVRISPELYKKVLEMSQQEMRSLGAQIEYVWNEYERMKKLLEDLKVDQVTS